MTPAGSMDKKIMRAEAFDRAFEAAMHFSTSADRNPILSREIRRALPLLHRLIFALKVRRLARHSGTLRLPPLRIEKHWMMQGYRVRRSALRAWEFLLTHSSRRFRGAEALARLWPVDASNFAMVDWLTRNGYPALGEIARRATLAPPRYRPPRVDQLALADRFAAGEDVAAEAAGRLSRLLDLDIPQGAIPPGQSPDDIVKVA